MKIGGWLGGRVGLRGSERKFRAVNLKPGKIN